MIDLIVVLIDDKCSLIFLDSLVEVLLLFIKKTNLNESVSLSFQSKGIGQDRILEITYSLRDLIRLCKYDTKLVEDLTSLIEVWRHLKYSNEGADGMII